MLVISKQKESKPFITRLLIELKLAFLIYLGLSVLMLIIYQSIAGFLICLPIPLISILFNYKINIIFILSIQNDNNLIIIRYLKYSKEFVLELNNENTIFEKKRQQASKNKMYCLEIWSNKQLVLKQFQNNVWTEKNIDDCVFQKTNLDSNRHKNNEKLV
ncbi:MAG: hypothetical protein K8R54_18480 [Bacteroidales bacterium]|nr:hypothetical protein [Bacteroidales bacterium]